MIATIEQAKMKLCQPVWKKLKFKSNEMLQAEWKHRGWHVKASVGTMRDGTYLDELSKKPARLPEGCSYHGIAYDQGTGTIVVPGALFQCQEKAKEYLEEAVVAWLASRPTR